MKRISKQWLTIAGAVALILVLQGCSANRQERGSASFQGSSSNWGSSITFGVHSHGRGW